MFENSYSLWFLMTYLGKSPSYCLHGSDWITSCIDLWDSIPNCQFWNSQWVALVARVIKHFNFIDWECFLPKLFARYLNMFEVSVNCLSNVEYVLRLLDLVVPSICMSCAVELNLLLTEAHHKGSGSTY
jgi:hypothetical protein